MKKIFHLLTLLVIIPTVIFAQSTMSAESIIASINSNKPLALTNVRITGDLDLTKLTNMKLAPKEHPDDKSKTYVSTVTSNISFTNCTFTGNVLGYYNPDNIKMNNNSVINVASKNEVYNTNFDVPVNFENCTFEKEVAFKYSEFKSKAVFKGSKFQDVAGFKYTKFSQGPDFSGAQFNDPAVFKYVTFPTGFDFSNAIFNDEADFKYAKLLNAGNFSNARFKNNANFKYADCGSSVNLKGSMFEGSTDFKYTKLNNQQTTLRELTGSR